MWGIAWGIKINTSVFETDEALKILIQLNLKLVAGRGFEPMNLLS